MRIEVTDVAHIVEVPSARFAINILRLSAQNSLQIGDRDFVLRNDRLRNGVVIFNRLAGHDFHKGLDAFSIPISRATTIGLVSIAENKIRVIAGLYRFIRADLDGMFNQIGRSNDVFFVAKINLCQRERIG